MPIQLIDLCPYRSLLLCTSPEPWALNPAIEELRGLATNLENVDVVHPASGISNRHGLNVKFFHYRIKQKPTWLLNPQVEDVLHELVAVFRRAGSVAILTTESRLRDKIRKRFEAADQTQLGELSRIPAATLNSAYVQGKINSLWLSGTHRHVASQVDNKAISGPDLLYALDPLGDQTFFFTSAVSKLPQNAYKYKVGTSPHKSYIWAGPSDDGDKLCEGVRQLFDVLTNAPAQGANPLPMLAAPAMDAATLATVDVAYEAALLPSELLDFDLPVPQKIVAEKWSRLSLDIIASANADFDAAMSLVEADGSVVALGDIRVTMDLSRPDRISWTATQLVGAAANHQTLQSDAIEAINTYRGWLKVWYESGHTLVDQKFFAARFRDAQFNFTFADFSNFDVKAEKPSLPLTPAKIGAGPSLFSWVRQRWHRNLPNAGPVSGWLACNDGAMEIADFIHFEQVAGERELTLIHVKGSKSANANRLLSVSDFEIVVGQAIKNLRFLDLKNTMANFTTALNAKLFDASWFAGVQRPRVDMFNAMNAAGPPPKRRVVIVQPRVRQTALNAARVAAPTTRQSMIARQLDTLLLAAQANCRNLDAELVVLVDRA